MARGDRRQHVDSGEHLAHPRHLRALQAAHVGAVQGHDEEGALPRQERAHARGDTRERERVVEVHDVQPRRRGRGGEHLGERLDSPLGPVLVEPGAEAPCVHVGEPVQGDRAAGERRDRADGEEMDRVASVGEDAGEVDRNARAAADAGMSDLRDPHSLVPRSSMVDQQPDKLSEANAVERPAGGRDTAECGRARFALSECGPPLPAAQPAPRGDRTAGRCAPG